MHQLCIIPCSRCIRELHSVLATASENLFLRWLSIRKLYSAWLSIRELHYVLARHQGTSFRIYTTSGNFIPNLHQGTSFQIYTASGNFILSWLGIKVGRASGNFLSWLSIKEFYFVLAQHQQTAVPLGSESANLILLWNSIRKLISLLNQHQRISCRYDTASANFILLWLSISKRISLLTWHQQS